MLIMWIWMKVIYVYNCFTFSWCFASHARLVLLIIDFICFHLSSYTLYVVILRCWSCEFEWKCYVFTIVWHFTIVLQSLLCLGNSAASLATRRGRCSPSIHGELLSKQTWFQNWQIGPLIFQYEFLLQIVRIRTSFGLPYTTPYSLPHALYEFLMASHILGVRPANIFCKFFFTCRKDYCQKCRWPCCPGRRPIVAPYTSCYFA